jgi:hypothetical protein
MIKMSASPMRLSSRTIPQAYEIKKATVGTKVYFRGIIELSNICSKTAITAAFAW